MSARPLCASPRCADLGQHYDDCPGDCRGCLPRQAAPGARLCKWCTRSLERDITAAAKLYDELAEQLMGGNAGGDSGSRPPGPRSPNDSPIEPRHDIRAALTTWVRIVIEERRVWPPTVVVSRVEPRPAGFIGPMRLVRSTHAVESSQGMATWLLAHIEWLSKHEAAGELADQMAELAHGRPRRVAYPSGARTFVVAQCPVAVDDVWCEGNIRAVLRQVDALLPSELTCDVDKAHVWTSASWMRLGRELGKTLTLTVVEITALYGWAPSKVYRLACVDEWARSPDRRRPVLYVAGDVERTATRLDAVKVQPIEGIER